MKTDRKQKFNLIMAIIFMCILILPSLIWGGLCVAEAELAEELDTDLGEKREKSPWPEKFDADTYTAEIDAWYTDRVPFRSFLIKVNQKTEGAMESIYLSKIQPALIRLFYGNQGSEADSQMDISGLQQTGKAPPSETVPEETVQNSEHNYVIAEQTEANCLEDGSITYICSDCQDSYTEIIPAKGHDSEIVNVVAASYLNYGYTEYRCKVCGAEYRDDFTGKLIDTSYLPPVTVGEGVVLGRFNWLFYEGNNSISYYKGTNILEEDKLNEYLETVVRLQKLCDERGIKLQLMIAPNKEQMYPEYMPSYVVATEEKRVSRLVKYIRENSGIQILYPIDELKAEELYWQTYYKYDTHWNTAGAFIGTQVLYEALGMPVTSLHDLEVTTGIREGAGDLVLLGGLDPAQYADDTEYLFSYKPEVNVYEAKGGVDSPIYRSKSYSSNECNFVMLSDSFRLAMLPYLERDFTNMVVAHRDYVDSLKDSIRGADILVLMAAERYDNRIFDTAKKVIAILEEGTAG